MGYKTLASLLVTAALIMPTSAVADRRMHIVEKGETLSEIVRDHKDNLRRARRRNKIRRNIIKVGQTLTLENRCRRGPVFKGYSKSESEQAWDFVNHQEDFQTGKKLNPNETALIHGAYRLLRTKASVKIARQYKTALKRHARGYNMPPHVLRGIMALENGGATDAESGTGPCGVMQISRALGTDMGMRISKKGCKKGYDQRTLPGFSIYKAAEYLKNTLYRKYGRWDLAMQAYHDGRGGLDRFVRAYVSKHHGKKVSVVDQKIIRKYGLTWIEMYNDEALMRNVYGSKFGEARNYVWKAVAFGQMAEPVKQGGLRI